MRPPVPCIALAFCALPACSLDWPPPLSHTDAGLDAGTDAEADADARAPSDCDRCSALAAQARPDAPPEGATHVVAAGDDLQAALDAASPGDEIVVEAGATFKGSFSLPVKAGDQWITVRSSAPASALPGPCTRIGPEHLAAMPRLIAPPGEPALIAADGAHHFRFVAIELTIEPGPPFPTGVVEIGQGTETDPSLLPHHIELDRVYVHGDAEKGSLYGVLMNGGETKLINSRVAEIKSLSDKMSAVAGWNGPGPFVIMNDALESAGPTVSFGLAAPAIAGLVPADIQIRYCDLTRPLAWRQDDPAWDGSMWRTGGVLTIANGKQIDFEGNAIDNVWDYYAFQVDPGTESGQEPWGVVQEITIAANRVEHAGAGFMLRGGAATDTSRRTRVVTIRDNLMPDVGAFAGEGRIFGITETTVDDLVIEHDTVLQTDHIAYAAGGPHAGFVFRDSIVNHNLYGFLCEAVGYGTKCFDALFPGYEVRRNVIVGLPMGATPSDYPPDNFFPAYDVGFVDAKGDYHLAEASPYKGKATDGTDVGVRWPALDEAATCRGH